MKLWIQSVLAFTGLGFVVSVLVVLLVACPISWVVMRLVGHQVWTIIGLMLIAPPILGFAFGVVVVMVNDDSDRRYSDLG